MIIQVIIMGIYAAPGLVRAVSTVHGLCKVEEHPNNNDNTGNNNGYLCSTGSRESCQHCTWFM